MGCVEELREAVIDGQAPVAVAKVTEGLAEGVSPGTLLQEGLVAAMAQVGDLYEAGEIFVPEMMVAARAMRAALGELAEQGKVAIGTVKGDLHDIGKNLVAMFLEGAGFEIVDLGVDVGAEQFIAEVRKGANVVALSALLTTTMVNMHGVVAAIADAGLREQVRIIVGGAPITMAYATEVGADGYAADASSAVRMLRGLLAV